MTLSSLLLAAAFVTSPQVADATSPSAAPAADPVGVVPTRAGDVVLELPQQVTPSGRAFLARCDDAAFAASSRPKALADRCERWLANWRNEVRVRNQQARAPREILAPNPPRGIPLDPAR